MAPAYNKKEKTMKTEKYHLALAIVVSILSIPCLGEVELPLPEQKPLLISHPHPTLTGLDQLYVQVIKADMVPSTVSLKREELNLKIQQKLKEGGIKYVQTKLSTMPRLTVNISLLKIPDSQKGVFRVQTSLTRMVILKNQQELNVLVDVWKVNPLMQIAPIESIHAKVTEAALEQAEAFIHAYKAANPKSEQLGDVNDIITIPVTASRPFGKQVTPEYKYVASKNSKVFHKPECSWAKKISPKNLVSYKGREEAIEDGKKPCRWCKP